MPHRDGAQDELTATSLQLLKIHVASAPLCCFVVYFWERCSHPAETPSCQLFIKLLGVVTAAVVCRRLGHIFYYLFYCVFFSEWYISGDYLVLMVSVAIILPLSLLRNLGEECVCVCVLK